MAEGRPKRKAAQRAEDLFRSGFRDNDDSIMYLSEDDESQIYEELIEAAEDRPIAPETESSSDEEEVQVQEEVGNVNNNDVDEDTEGLFNENYYIHYVL